MRVYGVTSVNNSTETNLSGESDFASNNFRHCAFAFSNAVRVPYAAKSSYSITRINPPVSGPVPHCEKSAPPSASLHSTKPYRVRMPQVAQALLPAL
jgi:hypothetical protein